MDKTQSVIFVSPTVTIGMQSINTESFVKHLKIFYQFSTGVNLVTSSTVDDWIQEFETATVITNF